VVRGNGDARPVRARAGGRREVVTGGTPSKKKTSRCKRASFDETWQLSHSLPFSVHDDRLCVKTENWPSRRNLKSGGPLSDDQERISRQLIFYAKRKRAT
jgi:hypothetical protein